MSFTIVSDVRYRQIFDETVVVRQEEAEVLGLNAVGGRILDCVRDGLDTEKTITVLAEEFEVEPATLAADVPAFLAELVELGVLAEKGEDDGP